VRPGCRKCFYPQAVASCTDKYQLCSQSDLNSGALLAARKMGWELPVWAREPNADKPTEGLNTHNIEKMAICCKKPRHD